MDSIAGTGLDVDRTADAHPPALLVIVLDTNPYAWNELAPHISLSKAVSELLIFINAHLAFNHSNRVAVLASHCQEAVWLYPSSPLTASDSSGKLAQGIDAGSPPSDPNKYRPFALIEHELLHNLRLLLSRTTEADLLASPTSTTLAGTLTLALSYISKTVPAGAHGSSATFNPDTIAQGSAARSSGGSNARVLIVSTSGDLAAQYIPLMNLIFAAQHLRIPLDILKLAGDTVLLQQASYTTSGVFLTPASIPTSASAEASNGAAVTEKSPPEVSLLPTLLFAFLPDPVTRAHLVPPTAVNVDFRAACFCHRRVVDIGYVCSICLSIFCEEGVATYMREEGQENVQATDGAVPGDGRMTSKDSALCLTCGTRLSLRVLGGGAAAADDRPRKKKKKKRREGELESGAGTPAPTG